MAYDEVLEAWVDQAVQFAQAEPPKPPKAPKSPKPRKASRRAGS
ncbi:MAG: hypothetical protein ABJA86_12500 [Nocardioidaceae bacterium]